ncbi:MAG: dihydroorotate dehydrogenase, partial [Clostridiales bacterium]
FNTPIIVNIAGSTVEEYGKITEILDKEEAVSALEINISCPNVKNGGMAFGTNPETAFNAINNVRKNTKKPIIAKLSPNVTDIVAMAKVAKDAGADGLSLINTLLGMKIDIKNKKPFLGNVMGGLSGPAIKPVALRMVYQVSQAVDLPIIGQGGICTWEDAVEFLLAGATGVSVGTGNFLEPDATIKVAQGIEQYLMDNGFNDVNDIIGLAWKGAK